MSAHDDLRKMMEYFTAVRELHLRTYAHLTKIQDDLKAGKFTLVDMVNFLYVFRETSRLADDIRKELDGSSGLMEKVCCAMYIARCSNDQMRPEPIRTGMATGTPSVKMGARLPSRRDEPENFAALMKYLGVDDSAIATDVVRPHWPGIVASLTQLAAEGKPLPPGVDTNATYPVYTVSLKCCRALEEVIRDLAERSVEECEELLNVRMKQRTNDEE